MQFQPDHAYRHFNFLLHAGSESAGGGFQECIAVEKEKNPNDPFDADHKGATIRKIPGLDKTGDVTMKRGVVNAASLNSWLENVREGKQAIGQTFVIQLQSENRETVLKTWRLLGARITKHSSGPFNAKGTDVAMEELTLAYERLEME